MTNNSIIRRTAAHAKPYKGFVTAIFILNVLATPIYLLKPLSLKILIDSGFDSKPLPGFTTIFFPENFDFTFASVLWISIALVIIIALIENLYAVVIWMLNTYTGEKLVRSFRSVLFNHIQKLSLSYHDRKGTADAVYRLQYDTSAIRTLIIGNLSPIITSTITLIGIVIVMFTIHWAFGLITCCLVPPMALLIRRSTRKLKKGWTEVKANESKAMSVVQEVLTSLRVVKSFAQEDAENKRFMNRADIAMKGQLSVAKTGAFFYFWVGMIYAAGTAMFIYFGSNFVQNGEITLGILTMVLAYLSQIYGPLEKISRNLNEIQSSVTSLDRVFTMLDEEKEVSDAPFPVNINRAKGKVEFQRVRFGYANEKEILKGISFKIDAGDRVGIMGTTGSGKSTLFNLLMRFYDPVSGSILLDNTDIREFKLEDYRKQFAIVLQEPVLFSTTIAENISYGTKDAKHKDIVNAAILANAHEFISNLPEGYDTIVGERGMTLSGGERQRISIARAFIRNAPLLILDEPTSALDIDTETQILDAMLRLMEGRTTFMISHRLDALVNCNVILRMENGRLRERERLSRKLKVKS